MQSKKIIWLASYPKSGNTWLRIFLHNLTSKQNHPVSINELNRGYIASSKELMEKFIEFNIGDLLPDEINNQRPIIYRLFNKTLSQVCFMKVHDSFQYTFSGTPYFPDDITFKAIYIVRNPLDIVVSYAYHNGISYDRVIEEMNNKEFYLVKDPTKNPIQIKQKLGTWDDHISSWENSGLDLHIVKYEDMLSNPLQTFLKISKHLKMNKNDEEIIRAIEFSDFEEVTKQEKKLGFKEKSPSSKVFFRNGKSGIWKKNLSKKQIDTIINNHKINMIKFGYI